MEISNITRLNIYNKATTTSNITRLQQANVMEISNSPNDKHLNYLHYVVEEEGRSYQHSDIQNSLSLIKVNANDPQATDSCDNRIACLTPGYYLNSLGKIVPSFLNPKAKDFNRIRVNYQSCTANPSHSSSTSYAHDISGINSRNIKSDVFKPENNEESSYSILQSLRIKNVDKIVLGHININSIRKKFDVLVDLIRNKIDILLISETKIDNSFLTSQFGIQGYTPFRLDRSANGGGLLLYTRNDIPAKKLPYMDAKKLPYMDAKKLPYMDAKKLPYMDAKKLPYMDSGNIECIILEITISNKK